MERPDSKPTALSRRGMLAAGAASGITLAFGAAAADDTTARLKNIKALTFDVYGTCVDTWGSIVRTGERIGSRRGLHIDWGKFATEWQATYASGFAEISEHKAEWQSVSSIHDNALNKVLSDQRYKGLDQSDIEALRDVWQHLDPWPDTVAGLSELKRRFTLSTLSNADMSGMIGLAKNKGLPWDVIMAAELAQAFKPDPKMYQLAARYLGLRPEHILMVAAHKYDLRAAKGQGFLTAFVSRPLERGPNGAVDSQFSAEFDLNVSSLTELANQLQAV